MINPQNLPFSGACERNKQPILSVISTYLSEANSVLEVGSGTGQHAVFFAGAFPSVVWQCADQAVYLDGVRAQLAHAGLSNLPEPLVLDVNQSVWVESGEKYDAVYSANTLHIMDEYSVEAFFAGLPTVMNADAHLIVYGPFKYAGEFTSESNAGFDLSLRSRGVGSGIRDFEWVNELAEAQGLSLVLDQAMPANNQCLIWQK